MARQEKTGLDYFSHDVDIMQDKKMKLLKAKHGMMGYAVYLRLLEELYREGGYFIKTDDDFNLLFSDDNNIPFNDYILILNDCINIGLFNAKLHENYDILTSKRIQQNYIDATTRRKNVHLMKDFLLLENDTVNNLSDNVSIIEVNGNIKKKKDNTGTQSKGKEIKKKGDNKESNNNFYSCEQLEYFNDIDFQESWAAWMDVRKSKKCKTTERAMTIIYNKLVSISKEIAIKMIDKSVVSGWSDIFDIKPQYSNRPNYNNTPNYNESKWKGEQNFEFVSAK